MTCEGCKYYRRLSPNAPAYCCHYCIDVGHTRGGEPEDCAVREDGRKQGSRWRAIKSKNAREWEER